LQVFDGRLPVAQKGSLCDILSALAVATLVSASRSLRVKHGLEIRFQVSCDDQEASQMKHVMSHIVGCASLEKVGEVHEGQEVEFFASLVVVQEVVDGIAR